MFETTSLVFDEIKHANVHIFEEHFPRTSRKTRTRTYFATTTRYLLEKKQFPGHVQLVEFFTSANAPETGGMQLAFQSLDEYFEGSVAMISYHLDDPMRSGVARSRLEYYKTLQAPLAVFDGNPLLRKNASKADKLSENAAAFRKACLLDKAAAESAWTLRARMTQDGEKVSATVTVTITVPGFVRGRLLPGPTKSTQEEVEPSPREGDYAAASQLKQATPEESPQQRYCPSAAMGIQARDYLIKYHAKNENKRNGAATNE